MARIVERELAESQSDVSACAGVSDHARRIGLETILAIAAPIYYWLFYVRTVYNENTRAAVALLHGRLWIDAPGYMEHVVFHGRDYILHPPLAALLMVPAVILFGPNVSQTAVCMLVGLATGVAAWSIVRKLVEDRRTQIWLAVFWSLGTIVVYEATIGDSWEFVLLCGALPTLLALNEMFGRCRPLVIGIWAGLAILGRYDYLLALPFYFGILLLKRHGWRALLFGVGPAAAIGLIVSYNIARFGALRDPALWMWASHDEYLLRNGDGGPFQLRFVPYNLYTVLFMTPNFSDTFPYLRPTMMGQALILTSPAFLLAIDAPATLINLLLAGASLAVMIPSLLVYANGFAQFGARYWTIAYPFLFVLMAMSCRNGISRLGKTLIVASVILVGVGTWQVRRFGWG
jgi:hypothetical protein